MLHMHPPKQIARVIAESVVHPRSWFEGADVTFWGRRVVQLPTGIEVMLCRDGSYRDLPPDWRDIIARQGQQPTWLICGDAEHGKPAVDRCDERTPATQAAKRQANGEGVKLG